MNQREYVRNIGRIPRILFHIKRIKAKGPDHESRLQGLEDELARRKLEFQLAELDSELQAILPCKLKDLLKIKLEAHITPDSEMLKEMVAAASVGMDGAAPIAVLTPSSEDTVN